MTRQIVSIEQINALIAAEMEKHEECRDVKIASAYVHEPDADGCNWDLNSWSDDRDDVRVCRDRILDAVRGLRAKYNAPDPVQAPPDFA
ncbi:hypothetical protein [Noviherbaspirillum sp. Root189]|uniref:hypothetical protein n=1 Tax=Noviherbaspirillum sp. Root189 TaxID=1736487 RepID=UPI00070CD964|nr:hypothetical protein [Noviherbaspirillum sp. Root189]KRB84810.1 hypothetical protein ASE07_22270 [Noviherbaspirillum sp. Root189]